ncbi:MAG: DMT family transporter [Candidatus Babeliales bacterium]
MILILLLYALCASSFTISKAVLAYSAPIFFVAIRMIVAGLLLLGFVWYRNALMSIRRVWQLFLPVIFFHIYCAYVFDIWSLQYMTSFKSSFFFNLSPFITALLSYFYLNERLTIKKWIGLIIGFVGLMPMLLKDAPSEQLFGEVLNISIPEIFLLIGIISSCIGWISMKRLLPYGYSPLLINGIGMFYGGLLALGTSAIAENWFVTPPVKELIPFLGLTALIIVVCNFIFYNLYGYALHKYSPTFLSFAGFTCPLFTALFGMIFLNEQVTWHFVVASVVVFIGLYLFYSDELQTSRF